MGRDCSFSISFLMLLFRSNAREELEGGGTFEGGGGEGEK